MQGTVRQAVVREEEGRYVDFPVRIGDAGSLGGERVELRAQPAAQLGDPRRRMQQRRRAGQDHAQAGAGRKRGGRLAQQLLRLVDAPAFVEKLVQLVTRFRERRVGLQHAPQRALGLGEVAPGPQGEAEAKPDLLGIGSKAHSLLQRRHRRIRLSVAEQRIAEVQVVAGDLRRDFDRESELIDGLGYALRTQQGDAEQVQRVGVVRGEAQRQPEMPLGVGIPAGLEALCAGFELGERLAQRVVQNFSARWIAGRAAISFAQRSTLLQPSHSSGSAPLQRA